MKRLTQIKTLSLVLFFIIIIIFGQLYYLKLSNVEMTTRFILIGILTINIAALLTLIFLVLKNLFKLYIERRDKVPGYRFRSRLVTIFMVLILIPSGLLFAGATGLSTDYINRFFSLPFKDSLTNSVELARAFYDFERQRVLKTAKQIANGNPTQSDDLSLKRLYNLPEDATDVIREAFEGKEGTEIISSAGGDIIRAAAPSLRADSSKEVVVVELKLPKSIAEKSEKLRAFHEDILKFESFKMPLKLNYILILGFITLIIVFSGLWISLKISQGITEPIQRLAIATRKVAAGDLSVSVETKTDDEVGLLINSFNQMVKELKDNKDSLEKAYAESDKRRFFLENILENINSGVVFLDNAMTILTINKAACSILNINQDDFIGRNYKEFIAQFNSLDLNSLVETLRGKKIKNVKKEIRLEINEKKKTLTVYISGIWDSHSHKSLGLLVVFNDISAIIEAQNLIAKGELARNLAHEIKNPLTPIKLSTERLIKKWKEKRDDFDSNFEKLTNSIISAVESLTQLADEFSRYGKMPEIKKSPADIKELIEDVATLYRGVKDIDIQVSIKEGLPDINLDKEQIKRALINILDNAIKAIDHDGLIKISIRVDTDIVTIEIADNGPGISDTEKEKLFQPYFSRRKDGTGLGLAIAAKILADHGGQISVRDNVPRGSIFVLELPIT